MSVFRRKRTGSAEAEGIDATAVVIAASLRQANSANSGEGYWWQDLAGGLAASKYDLTLEVRVDGRDPYTVTGRYSVPRKADSVGMTQIQLAPGLELPVRVDPADPEQLEIDWEHFIADPNRKAALSAARQERTNEQLAAQMAAKPKKQQKMWAMYRQAAEGYVEAVRSGSMTRAEFDETIGLDVGQGRMDPADAEWARGEIDA